MADAQTDWRKAAAAEISERRASLCKAVASAERAAERATSKAASLREELEALDQSARVLGLPVVDAYMPGPDVTSDIQLHAERSTPLVKEIVLDLLKQSYPRPLRAKDIGSSIEDSLGRPVHYKTPGMTLYRLSEEGLVRREGRDWFFVPPEAQTLEGIEDLLADDTSSAAEQRAEDAAETDPHDALWGVLE